MHTDVKVQFIQTRILPFLSLSHISRHNTLNHIMWNVLQCSSATRQSCWQELHQWLCILQVQYCWPDHHSLSESEFEPMRTRGEAVVQPTNQPASQHHHRSSIIVMDHQRTQRFKLVRLGLVRNSPAMLCAPRSSIRLR